MARWWVLVQGWSCRHSPSSQFQQGLLSENFVLGLHAQLINPTLSKLGKPLIGITFAPCIIFTLEAKKHTYDWSCFAGWVHGYPQNRDHQEAEGDGWVGWRMVQRKWNEERSWVEPVGTLPPWFLSIVFALTQRCFRYVSLTNPTEIKDQNRWS